jgi:hypothetical protein
MLFGGVEGVSKSGITLCLEWISNLSLESTVPVFIPYRFMIVGHACVSAVSRFEGVSKH